MLQLKIPIDLKERINKLYIALWKAKSMKKDTTELEQRILKLEKRYVERAFNIKLRNREINELKAIVNVKTVFPGSKIVGVSTKPTFWTLYSQYKNRSNSLNTNPNNGEGGNIAMALIVKAPIRRLVDEGVYPAKVAEVIEQEGEQYGERIVFTFELKNEDNDDGSPVGVISYCTNTLSPKSKLRKFVEVLLGQKLSKDQAEQGVDLEGLVELPCQVVIVHNDSKDGNTYAKVDNLLPPAKGSK